jgi:hypothetical protein
LDKTYWKSIINLPILAWMSFNLWKLEDWVYVERKPTHGTFYHQSPRMRPFPCLPSWLPGWAPPERSLASKFVHDCWSPLEFTINTPWGVLTSLEEGGVPWCVGDWGALHCLKVWVFSTSGLPWTGRSCHSCVSCQFSVCPSHLPFCPCLSLAVNGSFQQQRAVCVRVNTGPESAELSGNQVKVGRRGQFQGSWVT